MLRAITCRSSFRLIYQSTRYFGAASPATKLSGNKDANSKTQFIADKTVAKLQDFHRSRVIQDRLYEAIRSKNAFLVTERFQDAVSSNQLSALPTSLLRQILNVLYESCRKAGVEVDLIEARNVYRPPIEIVAQVFSALQASLKSSSDASISDYTAMLHFMALYRRPAPEYFRLMESLQRLNEKGASACLDRQSVYYLVYGLVQAGQLEEAQKVVDSALKTNITISLPLHSIVIRGFLDRGMKALRGASERQKRNASQTQPDFKKATDIAIDLARRGVKLDSKFVKTFMFVYNKLLDIQGCHFWMDLAEKMDLRPLTPLYNTLLDTYVKADKLDDAFKIFDTIKKNSDSKILAPNVYTYASLIHGCLLNDQVARAGELLRDMRDAGLTVDATVWNSFIWHFGKRGHYEKAMNYLNRAMESNVKLDNISYTAVIIGYATATGIFLGKNVNYFALMKPLEESEISCSISPQDALQHSEELYKKMISKDILPSTKTITTLLNLYAKANQHTAALQFMKNVEENFLKDHSHTLLSVQQSGSSKPEYINRIVDVATFNSLAAIYLALGRPIEAASVLDETMPKYFVKSDEWSVAIMAQYFLDRDDILMCWNWCQKSFTGSWQLPRVSSVDPKSPVGRVMRSMMKRMDVNASLKYAIKSLLK